MELRFVHTDQLLREIGSSGTSLKSTLQELLDIKLEAPSIIEGLKIIVSKHIETVYIDPLNTKYLDLQKDTQKLEQKQESDSVKLKQLQLAQKDQIDCLDREIRELGVRLQNELANYLTVAAYDQAAQENVLAQ